MKFCSKCGRQLPDDAVFCDKCGSAVSHDPFDTVPVGNVNSQPKVRRDDTAVLVIKIFMILGCLSMAALLIPLAWCIPMTVSYFRKAESGEPLSVGYKICTLIFVSLVAGIIMLCMDDYE